MIVLFLILLIFPVVIKSSHFNGGTITWAPVNPSDNSSSVVITITQTYSWVYPSVNCSLDVPISTYSRRNDGIDLTCVANCLTQGGYSNNTVNIVTDCISSSLLLNMLTSQRSVNITLNVGAYFSIGFGNLGWRSLANSLVASPDLSVVCGIDLRRRPDGNINTPPVPNVASPQYVIVNKTTDIIIHVSDVNKGDDVRCRWSSKNSSLSIDECGDVCFSDMMPNTTNLSSCILSFTGPVGNKWYAITLQIEDFINTSSVTPMSSIPLQFLIYVMQTPKCSISPVIIPLIGCLEVQIDVPINYTLYIVNFCNKTVIIGDVSVTTNTAGIQLGDLYNSTGNASLAYVILNWTPQISQIGLQYLCVIAYSSEKVQSDQYCATFYVNTSNPLCLPTTVETTTLVSTLITSTQKITTEPATTVVTTTLASTVITSIKNTTTEPATTAQTTTLASTLITSTKKITTEPATTVETTTLASTVITSTKKITTEPATTAETTTLATTLITSVKNITTESATTVLATTGILISSTAQLTTTTKATSSVPNNINIPLIVLLSLLALLLALCCCCYCCYKLLPNAARRRRQRRYSSSDPKHRDKTFQFKNRNHHLIDSKSDIQNSVNSLGSTPRTETISLSMVDDSKIGTVHVSRVSYAEKPHENGSTCATEYSSIISQPSVVTVHQLKTLRKPIPTNEQQTSQEDGKRGISVTKLPRNKISASCNTESSDRMTLYDTQSNLDVKTNRTTSIGARINLKQNNSVKNLVRHRSCSNTQDDMKIRRPATNISNVTVCRVKRNTSNVN